MSAGVETRCFLRSRRHGVLSTLSRKFSGYPFGSVVPYVLDHDARPVILISRLAEHTRNIEHNPHVSLLVHDASDDVQAGARLTLIGDAQRLADQHALQARYLRYAPDAERLLALGDFSFFAVAPLALRFIGGFGDIHWVNAASYAPPPNQLAEQEDAILAHMNRDHAHNLRDYCRSGHGKTADSVQMIGIDCDGFDVRADGAILRFNVEQPVTNAHEARRALAEMAKQSRTAERG